MFLFLFIYLFAKIDNFINKEIYKICMAVRNITFEESDLDRIKILKSENPKFIFSEFVRFCIKDRTTIAKYLTARNNGERFSVFPGN